MFRLSIIATLAVLALSGATPRCHAAVGDASFRAADRTVHLNSLPQTFTVDVFVEIDGLSELPSIGWGMIVNVVPQSNAVGTVVFDPPAIVNDEPNLAVATQSPFIDFDRDFGGMAYGNLAGGNTSLNAFSTYIEPVLGPAPTLDANGNLSLPHGSGLVSLPLVASAGAAGRFDITFDPDPHFTGVIFDTGMPEPNDIGIHPTGQHVAGVVTIRLPGDYNLDGTVDAADYVLWRKTDGTSGGYDEWRAAFGQVAGSGAALSASASVPEPSSALWGLWGWLLLLAARRRPRS